MNVNELRTALSVLRTKTAAPTTADVKNLTMGQLLGKAREGVGHVWDAANKGAQSAASHLEGVGAPKAIPGAVRALPTVLAGYGALKAVQSAMNWNRNRVLTNMQQGGYY